LHDHRAFQRDADVGSGPHPRPEASSNEGTMSTTTISKSYEETQSSRVDLDARYRQIGISAVAAALRYQSDRKNPRYARIDPLNADTTQFAADAA
jgi:hypothetical protein